MKKKITVKKRRRKIIVEEIIDEKGNILEETYREEKILGYEGYADFNSCANYLIQFFFKTEKKYSCTRMKVGKLLSILAFKYAVKGIELFYETIYWDICNIIINELKLFYPIDCYYQKNPMDDANKIIDPHELKEEIDISDFYKVKLTIPDEVMKDIEELFYNFGAYDSYDLSRLLKPIVGCEGICRPDGSIDLEAIAHLDKNQFPDNKVIEFIFKN